MKPRYTLPNEVVVNKYWWILVNFYLSPPPRDQILTSDNTPMLKLSQKMLRCYNVLNVI